MARGGAGAGVARLRRGPSARARADGLRPPQHSSGYLARGPLRISPAHPRAAAPTGSARLPSINGGESGAVAPPYCSSTQLGRGGWRTRQPSPSSMLPRCATQPRHMPGRATATPRRPGPWVGGLRGERCSPPAIAGGTVPAAAAWGRLRRQLARRWLRSVPGAAGASAPCPRGTPPRSPSLRAEGGIGVGIFFPPAGGLVAAAAAVSPAPCDGGAHDNHEHWLSPPAFHPLPQPPDSGTMSGRSPHTLPFLSPPLFAPGGHGSRPRMPQPPTLQAAHLCVAGGREALTHCPLLPPGLPHRTPHPLPSSPPLSAAQRSRPSWSRAAGGGGPHAPRLQENSNRTNQILSIEGTRCVPMLGLRPLPTRSG